MRLVRVENLATTGDWYDSTIKRSNAPYGDELHWTRIFDILLIIGAWIGTPFWGFSRALLYWSIIINPIIGIVTLLTVFWAIKPYLDSNGQRLAGVLFLCQLYTWETFLIGHPDHHGLQILIFTIVLGLLFRIMDNHDEHSVNLSSIWLGITLGIALWISVEAIIIIILTYIIFSILWIKHPVLYIKKFKYFNLSLLFSAIIFLIAERPIPNLFIIEYDKISFVYIFVFFISFTVTHLLELISANSQVKRLFSLSSLGLISLIVLWFIFPGFWGGPFVRVNKQIVPIWLNKVSEVQPLWDSDPIMLVTTAINFIIVIVCALSMMKYKHHLIKAIYFPLFIALIVYLPIAWLQIRWFRYINILTVFALAPCFGFINQRISKIKIEYQKRIIRIIAILLFCFGPFTLGLISSPETNTVDTAVDTAINNPPLSALCTWLNNNDAAFPDNAIILASIDYGPEILYRTSFRIIAAPYHRNDSGILYVYNVMNSPQIEKAYQMLENRNVNLILLSKDPSEINFFDSDNKSTTFRSQLIAGNSPEWLDPVQLPDNLSSFYKLFKVNINNH